MVSITKDELNAVSLASPDIHRLKRDTKRERGSRASLLIIDFPKCITEWPIILTRMMSWFPLSLSPDNRTTIIKCTLRQNFRFLSTENVFVQQSSCCSECKRIH